MTLKRIESIDFVRGVVMIIMALDHVRDLMHIDSISQSPTNLLTTTPLLFFTRFVTHLCAPTFVFLAGTSAYLSFIHLNNRTQSRNLLIKRGLWLILLEFTIINFGIFFDPGFHILLFQVIATIGFGFIMLGLLLKLPSRTLGIIGLSIIFLHNLIPLIPFADGSLFKSLLTPFFELTAIPLTSHTNFVMGYPPIPWLGILLVGFASGEIFSKAEYKRKNLFIKIGLGSLLLFVILRLINTYGDPLQWASQKTGFFTFMSFINVTKYPPSLQFSLVMLGILFLILALSEKANNRLMRLVSVYGKVPFFYFLVHFYLIHLSLILLLFLQRFQWSDLTFATGTFGRPAGVNSGIGIGGVYIIWVSVVVMMYLPCIWFGKYKANHNKWWLKYI